MPFQNNTQNHDLNNFSCGLDDMDDFLKDDALDQQNENLNVTYLARFNNEIVGFFSFQTPEKFNKCISTDKLCFENVILKNFLREDKYNSLGLGTVLLDNTCYQIKRISEIHGVRFITVDAYCNVRGFYYKNEFNHLKIHNPQKLMRTAKRNPNLTIPLYKDLKRI